MEGVRCRHAAHSFDLDGPPEQSILNVTFVNVSVDAAVGGEAACRYIDCTCDESPSCPSCCKRRDGDHGLQL